MTQHIIGDIKLANISLLMIFILIVLFVVVNPTIANTSQVNSLAPYIHRVDSENLSPRFSNNLVKDSTATGGVCVHTPGIRFYPNVRWYSDGSWAVPGTAYVVYARVKVRKIGNKGPALSLYCYDVQHRKWEVNTITIPASELSNMQWKLIKIGVIHPSKRFYVNVNVADKSTDIQDVYVDYFECIPQVPENKRASWLKRAKSFIDQHASSTFTKTSTLQQQSRANNEHQKSFLFGVYFSRSRSVRLGYETPKVYMHRMCQDLIYHNLNTMISPVGYKQRMSVGLLAPWFNIPPKYGININTPTFRVLWGDHNPTHPLTKNQWDMFKKSVDSLMDDYGKQVNSSLGVYLFDEPKLIQKNRIARAASYLQSRTQAPVFAVFNHVFTARRMARYVDIPVADPYPIHWPTSSLAHQPWFVGAVAGSLRKSANGKPFWLILQAFGLGRGSKVPPTTAQLRLMTNLSIAHGAHGIIYFSHNYWPGWSRKISKSGKVWQGGPRTNLTDIFCNPTPLYEQVGQLAHKLMPLGPMLVNSKFIAPEKSPIHIASVGQVDTGIEKINAIYLGVLGNAKRNRTIIALVNNDLNSARSCVVKIDPKALAGKGLINLLTLKKVDVKNDGTFGVRLSKAGAAYFCLANSDDISDIRKQIEIERVKQDTRQLDLKLNLARKSNLKIKKSVALRDKLAKATKQNQPDLAQKYLIHCAAAIGQAQGDDINFLSCKVSLRRIRYALGHVSKVFRNYANYNGKKITSGSWQLEKPPYNALVKQSADLSKQYFHLRAKFESGGFRQTHDKLRILAKQAEDLSAQVEDLTPHLRVHVRH